MSDTGWNSYGIQICKSGDEICPWDLLQVNRTIEQTDPNAAKVDSKELPWMALFGISIYRLIRAQVEDYRRAIKEKIDTQLAIFDQDIKMTVVIDSYAGWINDRQYNMLIAGIVMFFYKFSDHQYSMMRIGTMGQDSETAPASYPRVIYLNY